MSENSLIVDDINIQEKIYTIRGLQVMLDRDLAELYGVETKVFKQAVNRNIDRFPSDFMFELTKDELENWRSQFVTSNSDKMGLRRTPYVFTEQGVSMLSAILKSKIAIDMSVKIIRSFVNMRKIINQNSLVSQKFEQIERKFLRYDEKFDKIFDAIEQKQLKPKDGIFYDGQIFDAYNFIADILRTATKSIILIDNYIDDTTLTLFSKVPSIDVTIYTHTLSKQLKQDFEKYNTQYKNISLKTFKNAHDRFLIIDEKEVYLVGASLKDLGKKWFGFSKLDISLLDTMLKSLAHE
jgi:hypothetical protein